MVQCSAKKVHLQDYNLNGTGGGRRDGFKQIIDFFICICVLNIKNFIFLSISIEI